MVTNGLETTFLESKKVEVTRDQWKKVREIDRGDFCPHSPDTLSGEKAIRTQVCDYLGLDPSPSIEYLIEIKK